MNQNHEKLEKLKNFITDKFISNELNEDDLVQLIEHCGTLAQLYKISTYAKLKGKSYNGVKNFSRTVKLFGYKFAY